MNMIMNYYKRHPFIFGIVIAGSTYISTTIADKYYQREELNKSWDKKPQSIGEFFYSSTSQPSYIHVTCAPDNFILNKNMTIIHNRGNYIIHNAGIMHGDLLKKFDSEGKPTVLIIPSGTFRSLVDVKAFKARYPSVKVICPEAVKNQVSKVIKVDDSAEATLLSNYNIRTYRPPGLRNEYNELIYEVDLPGGGTALMINEMFCNLEKSTGLQHLVYGTLLGMEDKVKMGKLFKWNAINPREKKELKIFLNNLVDNLGNVKVVTFSCGKPLTSDITLKLRDAIKSI